MKNHLPGILYLNEENVNEFKKFLSDENFNKTLKNAIEIK